MNPPVSRGLWIAFFGPDGVGKSAVIDKLQTHSFGISDRSARFHFRPRFHRHPHDGLPVTSPHGRPPRSWLVSLGKLAYWLTDCWYGYFVAVRPIRNSGGLVVFDRYYPDVLVDPRRYRLPKGSVRFARWLLRFAPRPDLYVLLDAPAEVIRQRKTELSFDELHRQRIAYLKMFEGIRNKLLVNANNPVDEIARNIGVALEDAHRASLFENSGPSLLASL